MRKHGSKTADNGSGTLQAGRRQIADTAAKKNAIPSVGRSILRSWMSLHVLVVFTFLGYLLFAMVPVWYSRATEQLRVLLSEVTIEAGQEREWKLLPTSARGLRDAGKTELLPPSRFNHSNRQLVLVAASPGGGFIKLLGQCKPSPVSGPWDLDCNGDWANVRDPNDELGVMVEQKTGIREHGRFTVAFLKGGREGNITLMTTASSGLQPVAAQKFFMVRGKKLLYDD